MADYSSENPAPWMEYDSGSSTQKWTLYIDGNVTYIGSCAFNALPILGTVTLPYTCSKIGSYAFTNCDQITDVNLENVAEIGDFAFRGCSRLATVNLTSAKYVDSYSFCECTRLSSVIFGDQLTDISLYAFKGTALQSLTFPASLLYIGIDAFAYCEKSGKHHV